MVARKVLDGLRKGKKDVYALNIQYVKRYRLLLCYHMMHISPHDIPPFLRAFLTQFVLTAILQTATSSNAMTRYWHCVSRPMNALTGESVPQ
jgi:hypothetical protein